MKLRLKDFGSFQDCTFEMPAKPGLFFMKGDNREEPRLGANGAGKSTVWAALFWLLYGKTPKGLRAGDAARWASDTSLVELYFDNPNGVPFKALRSWSPNLWRLVDQQTGETWDLGNDKENQLLAWVGLTAPAFLNCVLMSQKEPMFLDMKPEAKASLFSEVMDLGRYLELSALAGKRAAEYDSNARRLESTLASLKGSLGAKQQDSTDMLKRQSHRWEEDRKERLAEWEADLVDAEKEATKIDRELKALKWPEANGLPQQMAEARTVLGAVQEMLQAVKAERKVLMESMDKIDGQTDCPTCGQSLEHAAAVRLITEREHRISDLANVIREVQAEVNDATDRVNALTKEHDDLTRKRTATSIHKSSMEDRFRRIEVGMGATLERIEKEKTATNPFLADMQRQQDEIEALQQQVKQAQAKYDEAMQAYLRHDFWIKGFKDLRLQQISQALTELEVEANNCLSELGLVDWEMRFDVDRETKSGTIQRGFAVNVISPHNSRPVPWEAWSGGEAQRLRIACNMGLANLIRSRTGCQWSLEVWDEPSAGLTQQGITDLLDALTVRAEKEQRQIWVVDHHSLGYGGFAGTCTVIKEAESGSRVEWGL